VFSLYDLTLRRTGAKQFEEIYQHIEKDFPPGERPPYAVFLNYIQSGKVQLFALADGEKLAGYALVLLSERFPFGLIWYLAILPAYRGQTFGTALLRLLRAEYRQLRGVIVEVERIESAETDAEKITRQRRVKFYENAGFRTLSDYWILYGVPFRLMFANYDGEKDHFAGVNSAADQIYRSFYQENARISYVPEAKK
jgi:ribosomal protein S18 acetylase RimI-like enzyme